MATLRESRLLALIRQARDEVSDGSAISIVDAHEHGRPTRYLIVISETAAEQILDMLPEGRHIVVTREDFRDTQ